MTTKAAAAVLVLAALPAAAEVRYATFSSSSLGSDVAYAVQLPPSYATATSRRYPVVYAFHGLFESPGFWERRGLTSFLETLWQKGEVPEMVVVAVICPRWLRYSRLTSRPERPLTTAEAEARDYQEIENLEKGGPIALADFYLHNDREPETMLAALDALVAELAFQP